MKSSNPKAAAGAKKAPLHLVPPALNIIASDALAEGADKYGPFNWRHEPVDIMTYIGAMQRHLDAFRDGEDIDPESAYGKLHLGGIAACVAILSDSIGLGIAIDNRPPKGPAPEMIRARSAPPEPAPSSPVPVPEPIEDSARRAFMSYRTEDVR